MRTWLLATALLLFPATASSETLREAAIRLDASATPPPYDAPGWEPVTLPDAWRERRPEREGFAWYRLELPAALPETDLLALYLPSLGMNAAVFVNGVVVGSGGRFEEPMARNFNRPLYFQFSPALLREGRNVVHVRLWCYATPHHGYLAPIEVGPDAALRPRYEVQLFRQARLTELSSWLSALLLLFLAGLWVGSRFEDVYGWFVLSGAFWTVSSVNYWVRDPPLATWTWERVSNAPVEGFTVAFAIWVHRFLGLERPRTERVLLAFAAFAFAATALLPAASLYPTVLWLHASSLAIGLYGVGTVLRRWRSFSRWQAGVYVVGGALCIAFAAHDLALQASWLPATSQQLFPFVVPVMLFAFGATLVARFVASLRAAESLSRDLERRVAAKSAELAASHARMRELERAHVLAQERERLMREMHDGLGGHLVSALSLAEAGGTPPEAVAAALREALDDMRAVIDSLDPHLEDLGQLLGQLRSRLEPVLRRRGLRLAWSVDRGATRLPLGPEHSLHVLRILQEAITNVVKHAGASEVRVSTRAGAAGVTLTIADDGHGLDPAATGGRGLANMRARAAQLGAALRIDAGAGGTRVELELPTTP